MIRDEITFRMAAGGGGGQTGTAGPTVYQGTVSKVWFGWSFWYHRSIAAPSFQL